MPFLIDGYNLLHASGLLGRKVAPKSLERARVALLNFIANSLNDAERKTTTVVFDAKTAPSGLPRQVNHHGLDVRFAVGFTDADALIEELIRADSSPRRLVVVSSDHQIQKAAKRRRATSIDSDDWHAELCRRHRTPERTQPGEDHKPIPPNTEAEVAYWLNVFGDAAVANDPADTSQDSASGPDASAKKGRMHDDVELQTMNPFPPGYADDLIQGEDEFVE